MKVKLYSQIASVFCLGIFLFSSCKTGPHNPYMELKEKPSTTINKGNQKQERKAKKLSKRQLKKTKRSLGY